VSQFEIAVRWSSGFCRLTPVIQRSLAVKLSHYLVSPSEHRVLQAAPRHREIKNPLARLIIRELSNSTADAAGSSESPDE
jgi:hypothetical protein